MDPALLASFVVLTWLLGLAGAGVSLLGVLAITHRRFVRGRGLRAVVLTGPEAVKAGAVLIPSGLVLATPFLAFGVWGVIALLRGGL
jgi:hypothetical protein